MSTVCVIGAGIVGCASAYRLARDGHRVHLVDAAEGPGRETSAANGAQLSYSYVEPLASPATLRALPKLLFAANAPVRLRLRLRADLRQWAWSWQFLRACRAGRVRSGTAQLLALAQLSRETLEQWLGEEDWRIDFARNGKLVLCPDAGSLAHQESQVAFQATLGCHQQVLTAAECLQREPALALRRGELAGGIWTADECIADPRLLCEALVRGMQARGGAVSFGTKVQGFVHERERILAACTSQGEVRADAFVLATGPHAPVLASRVGLRLPVQPIKGYSITVPFRGADRPVASVTDLGRKTVFAPLGDRLRVAAMAELGARDLRILPARVNAMLESVQATYPGLCDLGEPLAWAGLRPATPDSLPWVGQAGPANLFLNVGHGALGLTLAAGCAARLSGLLR